MLVVIANNLPDAVRGKLKQWFVEPKANVFISGIKDNVADNVIDFLLEFCPDSSGLIVFKKISAPPGYRIYGKGEPKRELFSISGLQLVLETDVKCPHQGIDQVQNLA